MTNFERKIAIIGIGLATITAALFYVQLNEMTKQTQIFASQTESAVASATQGERDTRTQLRIAQQQATAAQDSVKAIQRQMRQDQRAWIKPTPGSVDFDIGKELTAPFTWANIGKTPGIEVYGEVALDYLDKSESPQFFREGTHVREHPRTGIPAGSFFPTETATIPLIYVRPHPITSKAEKVIMTEKMNKDFWNGDSYVAIHGFIRYKDVFGGRHYVTFCKIGTPVTLPQMFPFKGTISCMAHNRTD